MVDSLRATELAALKPLLRAYALAYVTTTSPRLFGFAKTLRRRDWTTQERLSALCTILKTSTHLNRFPAAAAVIVGGSTLLPRLVDALAARLLVLLSRDGIARRGRRASARLQFACSCIAAWVAFGLLNRDYSWVRKRANSRGAVATATATAESGGLERRHVAPPPYHPHYAGKTIDFTLFALCRALDIAIITVWTRSRARAAHPERRVPGLATVLRQLADPTIFAVSSALIMWSWFYSPYRLPRPYNHWISKAADIDPRLIEALRRARQGDFVYGADTGQAHLLAGLCRDLRLPTEYADPAKTVPIPCELYHAGVGKSCERHALSRFWRSWKFAMEFYVPLQLLTHLKSPRLAVMARSVQGAARSSAFLAAFVSMFYYSVCLARSRLGPRLLSSKTVTPQMWDSGLCVLAGCLSCGWSIFLEKRSRRQEIAFFVAPRALATVLPRVYDQRYMRREQAIFAASVAVVMTTVNAGNAQHVRGVLGRILGGLVRPG